MSYKLKAGETRAFTVDFSSRLSTPPFSPTGPCESSTTYATEVLTGTPTVAEVGTSALTIANVALNTAALWVAGRSIAANQGVTFTVSGGTTRTVYTVRITIATDGTPAQTLIEDIRIQVQ